MLLFKITAFPLIIVLFCSSAILLAAILFEYIGEMGKDYIYAVTPLLEDALMDR